MATSSNQSGFVDNWQRGKCVTECNLHMLETEDFTDVTFLVGSEKNVVRAHRYVLASRSCVFHAMFCGPMAEQREIIIPDIQENVFKEFLRFLYTDNCTVNSENVAGLLYTSRKYDVETLFIRSASFLEESLSEENLCEILEKSHSYGETDLEQKALEMLSQAGPEVINSAGFNELCFGCFETFLKSENLNIDEEDVFEVALSWTKAKCEKEDLSPSHENMRKVLGELVYEIRFARLSLKYLAKVVGPSGILTGDERLKITDRILEANEDIRPFKSDQRVHKIQRDEKTSSGLYYVKRFRKIQQPSYQMSWHGIAFSTNKNILLVGCQVYGSDTEQTTRLSIKLYDNKGRIVSNPIQTTYPTMVSVADVMFTTPVSIQAGRVYTIYVEYNRNIKLYSGSGGVSKVDAGKVVFTFEKCRWDEIKSDVSEGQIPGLIWRY